MSEISKAMDVFEKTNDLKSLLDTKSESNITLEQAKGFWEDVFKEKTIENESMSQETIDNEIERIGGSYGEIRTVGEGEYYEVHHIPAKSVSYLDINEGPAIKMEKNEHRQTASCGISREAIEYRNKQKEQIDNGNFRESVQMDINDLQSKFGSKYDTAIEQMLSYIDEIEKEGKIHA